MLTKSQPDEIQSFLGDSSHVSGGFAERVVFPDNRRGEIYADENGKITIPVSTGRLIETSLPTYRMPQVRKHASGYYIAPGMDVIDLFIGSEGTLGVILDIEAKLLPKPEGLLS